MSINPAQIVNDNQQSGLLNLHLRKNRRKKNNNGISLSNVKASTNSNMLDLLALLEKQANAVRQSLNPDFVSNDFITSIKYVKTNDIYHIIGKIYCKSILEIKRIEYVEFDNIS